MSSISKTTDTEWQWNPYKILNIDPEHPDFFCVGRSTSKGNARCRKRIDSEDIHDACIILDKMATDGPEDPKLQKRLQILARLTLCKDWHQNQSIQIVHAWTQRIQEWLDESEELRKLQKQQKAYRKETPVLKERIDELCHELKKIRTANEREIRLRHNEEAKHKELSDSLAAKSQECEALQVQLTTSQDYGERLEKKSKHTVRDLEAVRRQLENATEEGQAYTKDLQDVIDRGAKEIQDLRKELEDARRKAEDDVHDNWKRWEFQRVELQEQTDQLRLDLTDKSKSLAMLQHDLAAKTARWGVQEDEYILKAFDTELRLQERIQQLEKQKEEDEEKRQRLERDLEDLRTQNSTITHDFEISYASLTAEVDRLRAEAIKESYVGQMLSDEVALLQSQFEKTTKNAKAEGERLRAEISTLHRDLSRESEVVNDSRLKAGELQCQMERVDSEALQAHDDYRKQVDHLQSRCAEEQKVSEGIRADLKRVTREKAVLRDDSWAIKVRTLHSILSS
ncbi:MAG: hypothetical protein Q9181_007240 [Wetmoreana brouardii]